MNPSEIRTDLFHLYEALNDKECTEEYTPLFVTPDQRIHYTNYLTSQIVFGFYSIISVFTSKSPIENSASKALELLIQKTDLYIKNTYQLYQDKYVSIHQKFILERLQASEDEKRYYKEINIGQFSQVNNELMDCYEATSQIWRRFFPKTYAIDNERTKKEIRMRHLLQTMIPSHQIPTHLSDKKNYDALKRAECLIHLEGTTEIPIPYLILVKLCNSEPLLDVEKIFLKRWIQKLNKKQQTLSIKKMEKVLKEIVNILHLENQFSTTTERLAYELEKAGCQLLSEPDPAHQQWRMGLRKGKKVTINQKTYTLKNSLRIEKPRDLFRLFPIEEDDRFLVMIGRNSFELKYLSLKFDDEEKHWGITPVKIEAISEDGKCILIQKLTVFLDEHIWTSHSPILDPKDEEKALAVASHLAWMRKYRFVVDNLELPYLGFDQDGILRTLIFLPLRTDLEDQDFPYQSFIDALSKINPFVGNFVMHVSEPYEDVDRNLESLTKFYREAISEIIQTDKWLDVWKNPVYETFKASHNNKIDKIGERIILFKKQLYDELVHYLQCISLYDYKEEENFKKKISDLLFLLYQNSPTPCLWEERQETFFKKEVMKNILFPYLQELEKHFQTIKPDYPPDQLKPWENLLALIKENSVINTLKLEKNVFDYYQDKHRQLEKNLQICQQLRKESKESK